MCLLGPLYCVIFLYTGFRNNQSTNLCQGGSCLAEGATHAFATQYVYYDIGVQIRIYKAGFFVEQALTMCDAHFEWEGPRLVATTLQTVKRGATLSIHHLVGFYKVWKLRPGWQ